MALLSKYILDLFAPRLCPICGQRLEEQEHLCPDCFLHLPRTEQATVRDNQTEMLFMDQRRFVRGAAYLFFTKHSPVQHMIHHIKYRRQPELGRFLGHQAALEMMQAGFFEGIDLIIPIPLHYMRVRERGYNQSEYIARGISEVTGIPVDERHHLTRIRNNPKQALMSHRERQKNVENIFALSHPEELYRQHILLVDDITTTGATLRSAMTALTPARSCRISVFLIGKAI